MNHKSKSSPHAKQVMLEHKDFKTGSKEENAANGGEQTDGQDGGDEDDFDGEPVPEFTVVKKQSSRLVLVLDRSGSMNGQRLRQLRQVYNTADRIIDHKEALF